MNSEHYAEELGPRSTRDAQDLIKYVTASRHYTQSTVLLGSLEFVAIFQIMTISTENDAFSPGW